jgi:hypothetical protein
MGGRFALWREPTEKAQTRHPPRSPAAGDVLIAMIDRVGAGPAFLPGQLFSSARSVAGAGWSCSDNSRREQLSVAYAAGNGGDLNAFSAADLVCKLPRYGFQIQILFSRLCGGERGDPNSFRRQISSASCPTRTSESITFQPPVRRITFCAFPLRNIPEAEISRSAVEDRYNCFTF